MKRNAKQLKMYFFFLLCFSFVPQPGSRSAFEPRRGLNVVKIFTLACLMKPVLLSVARPCGNPKVPEQLTSLMRGETRVCGK